MGKLALIANKDLKYLYRGNAIPVQMLILKILTACVNLVDPIVKLVIQLLFVQYVVQDTYLKIIVALIVFLDMLKSMEYAHSVQMAVNLVLVCLHAHLVYLNII